MINERTQRIFLGPLLDLRRLLVGAWATPPASRRRLAAEEAAARDLLSAAGCDLAHCSVTNLHTAEVKAPVAAVFTLFQEWRPWPCSAFFACPWTDGSGGQWFAYRFYSRLPIVVMHLRYVQEPAYIIYAIVRGIGAGGYHAFLFQPVAATTTAVSILTTIPPSRLFISGLHDQMNHDIYQRLNVLALSSL